MVDGDVVRYLVVVVVLTMGAPFVVNAMRYFEVKVDVSVKEVEVPMVVYGARFAYWNVAVPIPISVFAISHVTEVETPAKKSPVKAKDCGPHATTVEPPCLRGAAKLNSVAVRPVLW